MKLILQRYLLKEFFRIFIPTLMVLEFLLILGLVLQALHRGVSVTGLSELVPHIFFYPLATALPIALLAATVITYGRLSGDNELWAMLTNGIHLWIIVLPVALVGLFFGLISLGLNAEILPKSYHMLRVLQERAIHTILAQRIGAAQGKIKIPPYYVYIKSIEGGVFKNIVIMEAKGEEVSSLVTAKEGRLTVDVDNNLIVFALEGGNFIKRDPERSASSPIAVTFNETLFRIPLGLSEHTTFRKYSSLRELLALKNKVKGEIKSLKGVPTEKKLSKRAIKTRYREAEGVYQKVKNERTAALLEAEKSREAIFKEKNKLGNMHKEIDLAENYIRIIEDSLGDLVLSKELTNVANPQREELKGRDTKIKELNQTIQKERKRVKNMEEQKTLMQETIAQEEQNYTLFASEAEKLKGLEDRYEAEYKHWEKIMMLREKFETHREIVIAIHEKLSPALSCLAFVLVGIPIGIMTHRGNILTGFFISFLIVLILYYPLLVGSRVLATDLHTPTVITMWGPNLVIAAIGIGLLVKVFMK